MFDIFAIALFQLATIFGYTPAAESNVNETTTSQTEANGTVGSGGWGNDITAPTGGTVGSGGWGNDKNGK